MTNYYVRHEAETHENRRFLSTGMGFAENAYAYRVVVNRKSVIFCEFHCLR